MSSSVTSEPGLPTSSGAFGNSNIAGLCAVLAGIFGGHMLVCMHVLAHLGAYPFGDFFAIWTYAKIAVAGRAAELYDMAQMYAAEVALGLPTAEVLGVPPSTLAPFPFAYPPSFLLMLWPLAGLSYVIAFAVWLGVSLPLYAWATCQGTRHRALMLVGLVIAPTTVININFGQSGFLLAALLIGGLRIMNRRPVLAGVLFGLLTYKPQFVIVLPVALIAAREWRCIAAACTTGAVLIAGTTLAFGRMIWVTWLRSLPSYAMWADHKAKFQFLRSSVRDNLRLLGVPADTASLAQVAAIVIAAVSVWVSFRRGPRDLAVLILVAASCLAAPHAVIYDFPMLTGAALLFVDRRLDTARGFSRLEISAVLLTLIFPTALAWSLWLPVSAGLPALCLAMLLVARRTEAGATATDALLVRS